MAKATYASFAALYLFFRFKKKRPAAQEMENAQGSSGSIDNDESEESNDSADSADSSGCRCECTSNERPTSTIIIGSSLQEDDHDDEQDDAKQKCHNCNHDVEAGKSSPSPLLEDDFPLKKSNIETDPKSKQFDILIESTSNQFKSILAEEDDANSIIPPQVLPDDIVHVKGSLFGASKISRDIDEDSQYEVAFQKR